VRASALFCGLPLLVSCGHAEPSAQARQAPARASAIVVPASAAAAPVAVPAVSSASSAQPIVDSSPRVYSKTRFVWIRPEPDASKQWIGYLWTGESAKLVTGRPVYGPGCMTWYAVEPVGFVCVDGLRATLDPADPGFVVAKKYAADLTSAWPHQYGEAKKLTRLYAVEGSPLVFPNLPNSVHDQRTELRRGSTVAFVSELRVGAQDYLLGSDLSYVPKQLVTPFPHYEFQGLALGGDLKLPLAMFRGANRPKLKREGDAFAETGEKFARLSHVALTGQSEQADGERFLETVDGSWLRAKDAVVPTPSDRPPWGTATPKGRATWIEVSVNGGWLIAYENTEPVFTTLISPGRGAPPNPTKIRSRKRARRSASSPFPASSRPRPWKPPATWSTRPYPGPRTFRVHTPCIRRTGTTIGATPKAAVVSTSRRSTARSCSRGPSLRYLTAGTASAGCPGAAPPRSWSFIAE
jgi:hypothetical protein